MNVNIEIYDKFEHSSNWCEMHQNYNFYFGIQEIAWRFFQKIKVYLDLFYLEIYPTCSYDSLAADIVLSHVYVQTLWEENMGQWNSS